MAFTLQFFCKQNNGTEKLTVKQFILEEYLLSILCGSQEVKFKVLRGLGSSQV